jgi:hypothetical protein
MQKFVDGAEASPLAKLLFQNALKITTSQRTHLIFRQHAMFDVLQELCLLLGDEQAFRQRSATFLHLGNVSLMP